MNKKQISITLGIVCLILTLAIVIQIKTINNTISKTDPTFVENDLRDEVLKMKEKYDNTYSELEKAQKELEEERAKASKKDETSIQKEEELKEGNIMLGLTDVTGKGIKITLKDNQTVTNESIGAIDDINNYLVHDLDLLNIVNELKNAGAEAISINDQRVIPTTSITCAGNIIQVNGQKVGSPFVIKAIGIPETLYDALERPGSYLEELRTWGISVESKKENNISIQKYNGVLNNKYMKEVK